MNSLPIFPKDHPALCYERHDPNFEVVPHIHASGPKDAVTLWVVEVPDANGRVSADAVKAVRTCDELPPRDQGVSIVITSTMSLEEAQANQSAAHRDVLGVFLTVDAAHEAGLKWFDSKPADVFWFTIQGARLQ